MTRPGCLSGEGQGWRLSPAEAVCGQKWLVCAQASWLGGGTALRPRGAGACLRGVARGRAPRQLFLGGRGAVPASSPWTSCPQRPWLLAFLGPAVLGASSGSDMSHLVGTAVVSACWPRGDG